MLGSNLPFLVNNSQPNGPIIPSRPIFPSELPSDFRPSTSTLDTNYLNVKKIANVCSLRCKSLVVDDANTGTTNISFRDLPVNNGEGLSYLLVDEDGKVHRENRQISNKKANFSHSAVAPNMYQPEMFYMHETNMNGTFY